MRRIRLTSIDSNLFQEAWVLYESSFPLVERRTLESHKKTLLNKKHHFDVITLKESVLGIILWWELKDITYIEYFATASSQRGKGYGKTILNEFIEDSETPIILEVELPDEEIKIRRINFYKRLGFKLNNHFYQMGGIHPGDAPLEMLLMTYPKNIDLSDVEYFKQQLNLIVN